MTNLLSFYFVKKAMLKCADFWLSVRQMLMQKTKGTIPPHTPRYLSTPAIFDFLFASDILAVANLRCIAGLNRAMSKCADFSLSVRRTLMQKILGIAPPALLAVSKCTLFPIILFWQREIYSPSVVRKRPCRCFPISRGV